MNSAAIVLVVPWNAREVRKKKKKRENAALDSAENAESKRALYRYCFFNIKSFEGV